MTTDLHGKSTQTFGLLDPAFATTGLYTSGPVQKVEERLRFAWVPTCTPTGSSIYRTQLETPENTLEHTASGQMKGWHPAPYEGASRRGTFGLRGRLSRERGARGPPRLSPPPVWPPRRTLIENGNLSSAATLRHDQPQPATHGNHDEFEGAAAATRQMAAARSR